MAAVVPLTLAFVKQDGKILLGLKKRGFGMGKWNGFGGKLEAGESPLDAALRELQEEAGIIARELTKIGELVFTFDPAHETRTLFVHVFQASLFDGTVQESDEMRPQWFDIRNELPDLYHSMWPDDRFWFPCLLADTPFKARFSFRDFATIDHFSIDAGAGLQFS